MSLLAGKKLNVEKRAYKTRKMRKLKVIRSAVGSMPSLGLIKELQKSGIEVIGIDANPLSFGLYFLNKSYVIPTANNSKFIGELIKIIDKEKPNAILSGPEEEILVLAKNKKILEEKGVVVLCPDLKSVKICIDKVKTSKIFRKLGIPTPRLFIKKEEAEFPCIIKPRFGRGSSDIYITENKDELYFYLKRVNNPIIQEFIKGEEYTVDILADKQGNALSVVPRIRLETESGISTKGKIIYDDTIIRYCKKIVKELKLFGPSCIQCIKNSEGIKFIEINPRFGGGALLSIKADPTIIPNLKKLITNEKPIPSKSFKEGIIMLRNYYEIFISDNKIKGGI